VHLLAALHRNADLNGLWVLRNIENRVSSNHSSQLELLMSASTIEECVDEIDTFVATLNAYPEPVLAFALRTHLAALLRALLESQALNKAQAREFLTDLSREVFAT
jgi:hypothetical protein